MLKGCCKKEPSGVSSMSIIFLLVLPDFFYLPARLILSRLDSSTTLELTPPADPTKMTVNQQHLKQAWDVSQIQTKDDWDNRCIGSPWS